MEPWARALDSSDGREEIKELELEAESKKETSWQDVIESEKYNAPCI